MAFELVLNVVIAGLLTGLVFGLMALGLSVIFGVVRVVNFAHGEMMTIAMYATVVLFAATGLDPLLAIVPVAAAFFVFGYALQASLINPFVTRPEHSQFMLLVAIALIMVNALLMVFGPDARSVQVDYQLESYALGPILLGFVLWAWALRHRGMARTAPFGYLEPLFAASLAVLVLGDAVTATQLGGAVLVLAGVVLASSGEVRTVPPDATEDVAATIRP